MKKISQILLATIFVLSASMSFAQATKSKDEARIKLTAWVPPTIDGMPVMGQCDVKVFEGRNI